MADRAGVEELRPRLTERAMRSLPAGFDKRVKRKYDRVPDANELCLRPEFCDTYREKKASEGTAEISEKLLPVDVETLNWSEA
ncbi:MAG: hypothetical protein NC489_16340 [Ruminococcus flavefaciens]|nr:hypothetical protein [Ruminococcus flavefaciens]